MTSRFLKKILCLLLFCGMCTMKQQIVAASKAEPVDYVNPFLLDYMRSWNRASFQFFKTVVFRKDGRQMLLCL